MLCIINCCLSLTVHILLQCIIYTGSSIVVHPLKGWENIYIYTLSESYRAIDSSRFVVCMKKYTHIYFLISLHTQHTIDAAVINM